MELQASKSLSIFAMSIGFTRKVMAMEKSVTQRLTQFYRNVVI